MYKLPLFIIFYRRAFSPVPIKENQSDPSRPTQINFALYDTWLPLSFIITSAPRIPPPFSQYHPQSLLPRFSPSYTHSGTDFLNSEFHFFSPRLTFLTPAQIHTLPHPHSIHAWLTIFKIQSLHYFEHSQSQAHYLYRTHTPSKSHSSHSDSLNNRLLQKPNFLKTLPITKPSCGSGRWQLYNINRWS
jgi:hypothetical protein